MRPRGRNARWLSLALVVAVAALLWRAPALAWLPLPPAVALFAARRGRAAERRARARTISATASTSAASASTISSRSVIAP